MSGAFEVFEVPADDPARVDAIDRVARGAIAHLVRDGHHVADLIPTSPSRDVATAPTSAPPVERAVGRGRCGSHQRHRLSGFAARRGRRPRRA